MTHQTFFRTLTSQLSLHTTIKTKILALITLIGILLSMLLAFYSPNQAQKLGRDILKNDATFITNLLTANLSLSMQMLSIDDGAALHETLNLLKSGKEKKWEAISNIRVYDALGKSVTGLQGKADSTLLTSTVTQMVIQEQKQFIKALSPIEDMDKNLLGYVEIDFSKKYLNQKITHNSVSAVLIALFVLVATLILGFFISREVAGGIQNAVTVMKDIAEGAGDLTKRLDIHSNDEVGQLQKWINQFMDKIHDLVAQVKLNTDLVSHTANAISTTSSQMASGAEKQAERAIEAANTVENITTSIGQNVKHASETTKMAEEATLTAKEGSQIMQAALEGMNNIVSATKEIGKLVYSLSHRTDQIDEIIHIIDDIAIQTNLLAINASIEASRAGEQGKGFMVIAEEIHRLSDQTIQSTQVVVETIKSIQTEVKKAMGSMQETESAVRKGRKSTQKTEKILNQIVSTVKTSMEMIQSITASFKEQSAGVKEVTACVDDISQITKQASSGAAAMALAAKEMKLQTEALHEAVSHFNLKNS